jgi:hypothetical protein
MRADSDEWCRPWSRVSLLARQDDVIKTVDEPYAGVDELVAVAFAMSDDGKPIVGATATGDPRPVIWHC